MGSGSGRHGDRPCRPYRLSPRCHTPDSKTNQQVKQHRLRRFPRLQVGRFWRLLRRSRLALGFTVTVLILLTLGSRIAVAYFLANDAPGDGVVYARMATNLLEHGVFSDDEEEPITPTMIRTPGYPIFLAGVYYLFGEGNNTAVRILQAVVDTSTCVLS